MTHHKYAWREFKKDDLATLDLLEERDIVLQHAEDLKKMGESKRANAFCGTAFWYDRPLLVGGWFEKIPGVLQVFIIPTRTIFDHPVVFTQFVLKWLRKMEEYPGCHKIITVSLPIERITRWMEAVGFVYERTLKQYTESGQDYNLWSRNKVNGIWGHR